MNWLKQLFCWHKWKLVTEIWVTMPGGDWAEELHECEKCGKLRQRVKK